jgi:YegS/Rv2252/BmrU family lipid kinase
MKTVAIVNPNASGRRTGRRWARIQTRIEAALGPFDARFTTAPLDATRLTRAALRNGAELILAVGGDGTVNEVVNGFFDQGQPIGAHAALGLLTSGTGGDFRRTFDLPLPIDAQLARIAQGRDRPIDLGRLAYTADDGGPGLRYFDNIASFGLSGDTDRAVNALRAAKRLGGKAAFYAATIRSLLRYTAQPVQVRLDDQEEIAGRFTVGAVCNGQYFGGGMRIAPDAVPDDARFDVVLVDHGGKLELIRSLGAIYTGAHVASPRVTVRRAARIVATPAPGAGPVLLDVDGETPGRLPATFEMMPQALRLRC